MKAKAVDWEDDNSPNGVVSLMTEEEWKPKRHRLNAKQTQEKSEERMQVKYSRAAVVSSTLLRRGEVAGPRTIIWISDSTHGRGSC
jgi:hypothetical protein